MKRQNLYLERDGSLSALTSFATMSFGSRNSVQECLPLQPVKDITISYRIRYDVLQNGTKFSRSVDSVEQSAPKDFLTFIFASGNDNARQEIQSQLQANGLLLELNGSKVTCSVSAPLSVDKQPQIHLVIDEIRKCVLGIQGMLEFYQQEWTDTSPNLLANVQNSRAVKTKSLFIQIYERPDPQSPDNKCALWFVFDKSCKAEVERYTSQFASVYEVKTDFLQHIEPMSHIYGIILLKLGLGHALYELFHFQIEIQATDKGLQFTFPKQEQEMVSKHLSDFLSKFRESVQKWEEKVHISQVSVLKLHKVTEELQEAVANLPAYVDVYLQLSLHQSLFQIYARAEDVAFNAFSIIKQRLIEHSLPVTPDRKLILEQDSWRNLIDSVQKNETENDFVIGQYDDVIIVTGLKERVEKVLNYIGDLTHAIAVQDVDMEDVNEDAGNVTEKLYVRDSNRLSYLQKFFNLSDMGRLEITVPDSQNIVLKGSTADVQKAKQKLSEQLSIVNTNTCQFKDKSYLSRTEGFEFLMAVEKDVQVLCKVQNDKTGAQTDSIKVKTDKQRARHEKKSFSWEIDKHCLVKLAVAKTDDIEVDVIIEVVEEKMRKGRQCSFTYVNKDRYAKVCLSLPHYHPSPEVDAAHEKIDEIFEKVVRSKLTNVAVSIDSTASWALGSFVPLLLRSFSDFVKKASFKKMSQNLTLVFCSAVDNTVAEARKICDRKLGPSKGIGVPECSESLPINVQIVQGKLHETKADVLVNTIPPDKDLSSGQVSKALLLEAGAEMQAEMDKKYGDQYCDDKIFRTGGFKLPCSHVFHGVLKRYGGKAEDAREFYEERVYEFVKQCLEEADRLGCRSMAFPAIGTGRLKYPTEIVASSMFLAVTEFSDENPETSIEEVIFVVFPADIGAISAFTREEDEMKARMLKENNRDTVVTVQLVGTKENIAKAKQCIEKKLQEIKADSCEGQTTSDIDGVSAISFEVLNYFHADVISKYERNGCIFTCEEDVLTVKADCKDIQLIKTDICQCLCLIKDLHYRDMSVQDFDISEVEKQIKKRNDDEILHVLDRKNNKVLVFGKALKAVQTEVAQLNALICIPRIDKSSVKNTGISKEGKEFSQKMEGAKLDQKRVVKDTGRAKPNVEKVCVENIPFELYMAMKEIDSKMFKTSEIFYDRFHEQITLEGNKVKFDKLLAEVRQLQSQIIPLQADMEVEDAANRSGKVICVSNKDESTITVLAQDMKSVQEKVHQIKVDFGMVGRSDRGTRQLAESFQILNSPKRKDQQNQNSSGGARPKQMAGQVSASRPALSNFERFFTKENIPVLVYTQNILHLKVDCIVNAANDSLKHGGGIAEVISKAAGRKLDRDCNDFYKRNGPLNVGAVYASVAGKLPYECVIHAVGPRWSDYKPHYQDDVARCQRDLFMAVLNSFLKAEEKGMTTIAVPAISSAVFKVPKKLCTAMYAAAILAYSKQSTASKTRLSEIHFVDNKTDVIHLIQDEFRRQIPHGSIPDFLQKRSGPPKHPVPAGAQGQSKPDSKTAAYPYPYYDEKSYDNGFRTESICHFSSTLLLIVSTGAMFDCNYASVDGAVCSEDINGRGTGYTAKLLQSKGGAKYKAAKEAAFRRQPSFGDVVCCKGDVTGFKKVLHTVMWKRNEKDSHEQRCEKFRKMFKAVLLAAVKEGCKSIVMPLLFTGQGKVPADFCTDRLLEAFMAFSIENKHSKLTVYLVNDEQRKTDTIKREMLSFLDLQTATRLSKQAHQIPPNPQQRPVSPDVGVRQKPATKLHRSQVDRRQHDRQRDINKMSSTFTSMTVGSGDPKSSAGFSQFYDDKDDDDDDGRDSQGPSWETNDGDNDDVDDVDDDKESQDENCVICMDTVNKPKKLKCGHIFCTDCIDNYFTSYKKVCPTCGVVCGVIKGDQPPGNMDVRFDRNFHCAGFDRVGTHVITYSFNSGTQGPDHPNPGRPYKGITRTAFLPDTREGREVLKMLEVAFDRKLVFTIGSSRTTGQEGVITWNDIHHKTNPKPNTPFGYPDDGYLDRVKDELAVKGVTPEDIQVSYRSK